jgi:hypothetical protein
VNSKADYVNGAFQPYHRYSRFDGQRASKLLSDGCGFSVRARAVVAVMATSLTFKGQPDGVRVVGRKKVARWLSSRPAVLEAEAVEAIYAVARRRRTWQPAPDPSDQEESRDTESGASATPDRGSRTLLKICDIAILG